MIAYRTTWLVKPNCMQKALDLLTAGRVELGDHVVRIYTPRISPNLLVFEMTSASVQEHDKWWAAYNATPEAAVAFKKWDELVERRVGDEVWDVTEFR